MNRALRRISIAVLVMFLLLLINVNYLQGFEPASLASKPGNSRAFYAAQNQYERGSIVTSDGVTIAASKLSTNSNDAIKYQRYYPFGPEYAPVTGYDTLYSQTGIEAAENSLLSGNDSALDVRKIIDLITGKTTKGATVEVTINSQAQAAAYNALAALASRAGSWRSTRRPGRSSPWPATRASTRTSSPFTTAPSSSRTTTSCSRIRPSRLLNRALQGTYPPGSTFKIVTSSALLTQNPSTTINTNVYSPTQLTLPQTTHVLTNDLGETCGDGSGQVPLITAFAQSCDTTFGKIGMDLGPSALNAMAEKFGMNNPNLTVPLGVAQSNYVIPPSEALTAYSAIGQFSDTVTPLQEAMFAAAIANGGTLMKPYLVQQVTASDAEHGPGDTAVRVEPAGLPVRGQQRGTDDARRGAGLQRHGVRLQRPGRGRPRDRGQDRHGRDRHGHRAGRRGLHRLCPLRQPRYRRRRHNSRRRLRRLRGRTHRCEGHPGVPEYPEESVSDYLLAGRYRLTDRIAAGGMGEVWRGEDNLLNRAVAVKLLPTGRAGDEAFLARFRAEARYAASLSHPGIARVYDYGESSEFGGAYLVMELVNGEPLSAILARAGRLRRTPHWTSSARRRAHSTPRTRPASCTATSSQATCWSPRAAPRRSLTSASPPRWPRPRRRT